MKTYKIELPDDEFTIINADSDREAVRQMMKLTDYCFGMDELDDDYNAIRPVDWRVIVAGLVRPRRRAA
jgi:hypothetical protein